MHPPHQCCISLQEGQARRVAELTGRLEALEKRLQEASKARESRLRKAGLPARARMAAELRDMDTDILALTRTLAVRESAQWNGPVSIKALPHARGELAQIL